MKTKVLTLIKIILSFTVGIAIWQIMINIFDVNEALFPSPYKVLLAFNELNTQGLRGSTSDSLLIGHIGVSLYRFFTGYCISVVLAVLLGLLLGWHKKAFELINPVLQLLRPIAPVAWMPFIVLWFGIGDIPAIVIIFIAGFFPVLLSTVRAVQEIPEIYLKVAENFGISKHMTLVKIVFPAIFSQVMTSIHLALGTAWIFLVSGEMVGAQSGLGFLIMDTKNCMRMDALLATMITIGLIGFLLDQLIKIIERSVSDY